MSGLMKMGPIVALDLTWKGTRGFLGWGSLPPEKRGPLAYAFGRRYVRVLQKPVQAAACSDVPLLREVACCGENAVRSESPPYL